MTYNVFSGTLNPTYPTHLRHTDHYGQSRRWSNMLTVSTAVRTGRHDGRPCVASWSGERRSHGRTSLTWLNLHLKDHGRRWPCEDETDRQPVMQTRIGPSQETNVDVCKLLMTVRANIKTIPTVLWY